MPSIAAKTKDPDSVLDYKLNWATWLAETTSTTDTIASVSWTVGSGITKDSESNDTTSATIWLSGGTAGNDYSIACEVTTAGGRTAERTITIMVRER